LGGGTLAQSGGVGNAKLCQNDEIRDRKSAAKGPANLCKAVLAAVDKPQTEPYFCAIVSAAKAPNFAVLFVAEPGIA
jgi:hypothetical protein